MARWFAPAEQAAIERLQADRETAARELEEFVEAQADLDRAVLARYAVLIEAEISTLVVEGK